MYVINSPIVIFPGLAIDSTRNLVYVTTSGNTVSVIDENGGRGGAIIATITLSATPRAIGIDNALNRLYVTHANNYVFVINAATYQLITTLSVISNSRAIGVDSETNFAYIGGEINNQISVINGRLGPGGTVVATLTIPTANQLH